MNPFFRGRTTAFKTHPWPQFLAMDASGVELRRFGCHVVVEGGTFRTPIFGQVTFWPTDFQTFPPPGAHTGSHPGLALRLPWEQNCKRAVRGGASVPLCARPPGWAGAAAPGELELAPLEAREATVVCGVGWGRVGVFTAGGRATVMQNQTWRFLFPC